MLIAYSVDVEGLVASVVELVVPCVVGFRDDCTDVARAALRTVSFNCNDALIAILKKFKILIMS